MRLSLGTDVFCICWKLVTLCICASWADFLVFLVFHCFRRRRMKVRNKATLRIRTQHSRLFTFLMYHFFFRQMYYIWTNPFRTLTEVQVSLDLFCRLLLLTILGNRFTMKTAKRTAHAPKTAPNFERRAVIGRSCVRIRTGPCRTFFVRSRTESAVQL